MYERQQKCIQVLVRKHEGNRTLLRCRRRWRDDIKMDIKDMRWGMDWIDMAQDRALELSGSII
jgi:hypothetical protein